MKASEFIVVLLLMVMIILGFTTFLGGLAKNYNINVNTSQFESTYNKINETVNLSEQIASGISTSKLDESNMFYSMSASAYGSLKLIFKAIGIFNSIIVNIAKTLSIPVWAVTLTIALIGVLITFMIIKAIFRTDL